MLSVAQAHTSGSLHVIQGGGGLALHSHMLTWDNRYSTIFQALPALSKEHPVFYIVTTGKLTTVQKDQLKAEKLHACRKSMIRKLLEFLVTNNPLYKDVQIDWAKLDVADGGNDDVLDEFQIELSELSEDELKVLQATRARSSNISNSSYRPDTAAEAQAKGNIHYSRLVQENPDDRSNIDIIKDILDRHHAQAMSGKGDDGRGGWCRVSFQYFVSLLCPDFWN
ncbi:hypothetical protein BCR44DRAFT_1286851 [Catenaria anguillulae PL171]|uniref:DUF6570 domain-containing protein n=1 Tax=Catenaria anguillulae PL171 TaxID=765915 RepID=A0A1Y2H8M5_9FUNG|nr:hypothetical protein BCR44DRAFT_1286851 [Catenaria anguillulae PL171]